MHYVSVTGMRTNQELRRGDTVWFHTPNPDENPSQRYTLLSDPKEMEECAAHLRKTHPKYKAYVKIEAVCELPFKPIMTVHLEDLCSD